MCALQPFWSTQSKWTVTLLKVSNLQLLTSYKTPQLLIDDKHALYTCLFITHSSLTYSTQWKQIDTLHTFNLRWQRWQVQSCKNCSGQFSSYPTPSARRCDGQSPLQLTQQSWPFYRDFLPSPQTAREQENTATNTLSRARRCGWKREPTTGATRIENW